MSLLVQCFSAVEMELNIGFLVYPVENTSGAATRQ
jgi:hypothetical protein